MARHERAETVRKKRHDGTSSPLPSNRSVGAAIAFGGPVRGLTFNYVCNMRAITPGLLTSTRAHFLHQSVCKFSKCYDMTNATQMISRIREWCATVNASVANFLLFGFQPNSLLQTQRSALGLSW